jgi:membrane-associated phospholipid phosphatase
MRQPLKLAIAFVVLYLLAICTPYGQSVENAMTRGFSEQTWIYGIRYSIGPPPLRGEELTLVVGIVVIVLVAVLRRQWRLAVAGAFVPAATAVSTFVLNRYVLPRPGISGAPVSLTEASFPSGHVAITAGVAIGAILVCTPRARPYVVAAGTTWLAFIAAAVQNLGWHRPSDAIGATLLAAVWYLVAVHWLPAASKLASRGPVFPVLLLAAAGAVLGAGRTDYLLEAFVKGVVGLLCAVILWSVASEESRCVRRRVRYSLGFFGRMQVLRTLRAPYGFAVVAVVLMLAVVSAMGVEFWRSHSPVHVDTARPEPAVITGPGTAGRGVMIGKAGAGTNIDVFLDFRCGPCGSFEKETGATLDKLVSDGAATLTYWPMTFTDTDSPQLANAFAVAAAGGHARGFVRAIYDDPGKAWSEGQLVELGNKLGVPGFRETLAANSYRNWFATLDEAATEREVLDLPTVFVNNSKLRADQLTPEGLTLGLGS